MDLKEEKQEFDSSPDIDTSKKFHIAATARMYNLLSSDMYSDKIAAVIRETCCNANDAHLKAGQSKPFEVQLPCVDKPVFRVRDFGEGLDEKGMDIFTTFGESTKNTSNLETGAFGIGAKSPFNYTDSFSVISIYQGVKRTYLMYKDSDGCPTPSIIRTEPTEEPSGLEISFAVDSEDFREFREKAFVQLQHMADHITMPEWPEDEARLRNKADQFEWEPFSSLGEGFSTYNIKFNDNSYSTLHIIMAYVDYSVSESEFKEFIPSNIPDIGRQMLVSGYVQVPNGSIMPHPSRERLTFTQSTKDTIAKVIQALYDEFLKKWTDLISSFTEYHTIVDKLREADIGIDYWNIERSSIIKNIILPGYDRTYAQWRSTALNPIITGKFVSNRISLTRIVVFVPKNMDFSDTLFIKGATTTAAVSELKISDRKKIAYNMKLLSKTSMVWLPESQIKGKVFQDSVYDSFPSLEDLVEPTKAQYDSTFGIVRSTVVRQKPVDFAKSFEVSIMKFKANDRIETFYSSISRATLSSLDLNQTHIVATRRLSSAIIFNSSYPFSSDEGRSVLLENMFSSKIYKKIFKDSFSEYTSVIFINEDYMKLLDKVGLKYIRFEQFVLDYHQKVLDSIPKSIMLNGSSVFAKSLESSALEYAADLFIRSNFLKSITGLPELDLVLTASENSKYEEFLRFLEYQKRYQAIANLVGSISFPKAIDISGPIRVLKHRWPITSQWESLSVKEFDIYVEAKEKLLAQEALAKVSVPSSGEEEEAV